MNSLPLLSSLYICWSWQVASVVYRWVLLVIQDHVLTVHKVCVPACSVHTDSDIVIHRSSRLHLLLCTCSVAGSQTDSPHAELSTIRYWNSNALLCRLLCALIVVCSWILTCLNFSSHFRWLFISHWCKENTPSIYVVSGDNGTTKISTLIFSGSYPCCLICEFCLMIDIDTMRMTCWQWLSWLNALSHLLA